MNPIIIFASRIQNMLADDLKNTIRDIHDFPKQGIVFKDITPVLENNELCNAIVAEFENSLKGIAFDAIAGIESRGFLFGFLLAQKMGKPFILIRKAGKLPGKTIGAEYALEYGTAKIEMQEGSVRKGWNVLIHDDLLATGGTTAAAAELIQKQSGNVAGFAFVIELDFLRGREKINGLSSQITSLIHF
ncbi:MAG: adenine phosphoribosyltransferase [Bacteroidia bacterium]